MKKKILLAALAVSIMSLSACNSETGSATNDTVVSGTEESKAEVTDSAEIAETSETEETSEEASGAEESKAEVPDGAEIAESSETEETSEEASGAEESKEEVTDSAETAESSETEEISEGPQLEPVIALSYGDYEFDISNMTYKDLLAFFQAIGYPALSGAGEYKLEPYEYWDFDYVRANIAVGDDEVTLCAWLYNPTGEEISALDAKIYSINDIRDLPNIIDLNLKVLGVSANTFIEHESETAMLDDIESQISGFGYTRNGDEFTKRLDDGREITLSTSGRISITPVYDYGTY